MKIVTRDSILEVKKDAPKRCHSDQLYIEVPSQYSFGYDKIYIKPHNIEGLAIPSGWAKGYWLDGKLFKSKTEWEQTIAEARALPPELKLTDPRQWVRELDK